MSSVKPQELNARLHDADLDEVLIDVRDPREFQSASIPGSKNVPLNEVAEAAEKLSRYGTVYVTCGSGVRSAQACTMLADMGVNVVDVEGGLAAWQHAGLHTRGNGKSHIPVIRQVMLTAGLLNLAGLLLAVFVHAYWVLLSVVVGAGLTFAGTTGICFMSRVLEKMPWNR